jgi:voltage-gated potassium channel
MFERPFITESGLNFDNYTNGVWYIIVSMTTIGYGDYYPISSFGRIIGVLCCLWGVFTVSMSVATLNSLLLFSEGEKKAFNIL